jgi:Flp pilus assembly protein TadD
MHTGSNPHQQKAFDEFRRIEQLQQSGQHELALEASKALAGKQSTWPYAQYALATSLANLGRFEEARRAIRKAITQKDSVGAFHTKLGEVLHRLDDMNGARKAFDRAIELEPDNDGYKASLAWALRLSGCSDEALAILDTLYDSGCRDHRAMRIYASLLGSMGQSERAIGVLEPLANGDHPDKLVLGAHWYVLAKLYDGLGRYDDAYAAATRGAELNGKKYNPEERAWLQEQRLRAWSEENMPSLARSKVSSDKPVFIVGMPRSGTTLVEQIIGSHPKCYGAGELINVFIAVLELVTPTD